RETDQTFIYVTLNPAVEEVPEALKASIEKVEDIQGFVAIDRVIDLDNEETFLIEREKEQTIPEDEEASESEETSSEEAEETPLDEVKDEITETEKESKEMQEESDTKSEDNVVAKDTEIKKEYSRTLMQSKATESSTSRLGHIRGGNRPFYKTLGGQSSPASAKYQNKVYYIKKQAKIGSETFYLLSTSPSATKDLLGWMNAKDVDSRTHKTATKTDQQLIIKGSGKAKEKACGGSKDAVHTSMKNFKGNLFDVNLTERVGNNTWYRGKINGKGKNVWLHANQTEKLTIKESRTSRLGH